MVPLDVPRVVEGHVACEGHGEVVAQAERLAPLVRQVVDQLAVLAVLPRQRLPQLEDRGVDGDGAVAFEHADDGGEGLFPDRHLLRQEVAGALGDLRLATGGVGHREGLQGGGDAGKGGP